VRRAIVREKVVPPLVRACAGGDLGENLRGGSLRGHEEVQVEALGNQPPNGAGAVPNAPAPAATGTSAGGLSGDQRKATLDRTLQIQEAQGWRIESRSDFQATIAKGKPLNNKLHLILTIFTVGIWGIVWFILAITGGVKRRMITIDEYGNVIDSIV
jgi:hypothetical protein